MIETIWDYLKSKGFQVTPREAKKTVHLALESDKLNKAQKGRMTDLWYVSEKLDGVYSLVTVIPLGAGETEVRHWGRSGKALSNCEALDIHLKERLSSVPHPIIFISEITACCPLAKLSGYLTPSRVNDSSFVPKYLKDNFHDIITVGEFLRGYSKHSYDSRLGILLDYTKLNVITSYLPMTLKEAQYFAKEHIWSNGGEGLILRDPEAIWEAGIRNESMIKIKEKLSFECTVIGMVSGKEGSKYENTLGKLVVAFRAFGDPNGELLEVPISGMTDNQRKFWWEDSIRIIGCTVKVDAKSFTEKGNLREPRFKEIRWDKPSDFPVELLEVTEEHPIVISKKAKAIWELHPYD